MALRAVVSATLRRSAPAAAPGGAHCARASARRASSPTWLPMQLLRFRSLATTTTDLVQVAAEGAGTVQQRSGAADVGLGAFNATELASAVFRIYEADAHTKAPQLYAELAKEARTRLNEFRVDDIAQMCFCFHDAKLHDVEWYRSVAKALQNRLEEGLADEVASTLLILAREDVYDSALFDRAAERIAPYIGKQFERQSDFSARQLSMVCEAFTTLGLTNKTLSLALVRDVTAHSGRYSPDDLEAVVRFVAASGEGSTEFQNAVARHPIVYAERQTEISRANEDDDPTNIIYTMQVPEAYGTPFARKPNKFVFGEP